MDTETTPSLRPRSSLFTVRLWMVEVGAGRREVRMQVRHILSGETRYFRTWPDLEAFLLVKLPALDEEGRGEGGDHLQDGTP